MQRPESARTAHTQLGHIVFFLLSVAVLPLWRILMRCVHIVVRLIFVTIKRQTVRVNAKTLIFHANVRMDKRMSGKQKVVNACHRMRRRRNKKAKVRTAHTHCVWCLSLCIATKQRNLWRGNANPPTDARARDTFDVPENSIFQWEEQTGARARQKIDSAECNLKIDWNQQQGCRWHHNQRRQTKQETNKGDAHTHIQFGRGNDEEDKRSKPAFVFS